MSAPTLDVALCQYELADVGSVEALTDRARSLLDRAGPADVFVLPEGFAVDAATSEAEPPTLSQAAFDHLATWTGEEARVRDAVVVAGSVYLAVDGGTVNRCAVGTPEGEVHTYDKRRPVPDERASGVIAGTEPPPLVDVRGVTVGVLVCYDAEFPELVRATVDRGAELLVVPSWTATEAGFQRVSRCCAARAVENQAAVAHATLVGAHPGDAVGPATGRSAVYMPCDDVVGPHGTGLTLPRDEAAAASCSVDAAALRRARVTATVRPYADTEVFDR